MNNEQFKAVKVGDWVWVTNGTCQPRWAKVLDLMAPSAPVNVGAVLYENSAGARKWALAHHIFMDELDALEWSAADMKSALWCNERRQKELAAARLAA